MMELFIRSADGQQHLAKYGKIEVLDLDELFTLIQVNLKLDLARFHPLEQQDIELTLSTAGELLINAKIFEHSAVDRTDFVTEQFILRKVPAT